MQRTFLLLIALFFQAHPEEIEHRLNELDAEWDVERVLETGSSALTLTGLVLGITRSRKWLLLSLGVQGFFMQHALGRHSPAFISAPPALELLRAGPASA